MEKSAEIGQDLLQAYKVQVRSPVPDELYVPAGRTKTLIVWIIIIGARGRAMTASQ